MVSFTVGKQQELAARQAEVHALLNELYAALAEATANGGVDEATLEAARDAYVTANFYWNFEKGTAQHEDVGNQAAHNFKGSMEYLDRAEALVRPAIDSLILSPLFAWGSVIASEESAVFASCGISGLFPYYRGVFGPERV